MMTPSLLRTHPKCVSGAIICPHRLHQYRSWIRLVFASINEYISLFHFFIFYVFVFAKMMTLSFPSTCIQSMSVPGATNCSLPHQMQSYHVCLCLYPIMEAGWLFIFYYVCLCLCLCLCTYHCLCWNDPHIRSVSVPGATNCSGSVSGNFKIGTLSFETRD